MDRTLEVIRSALASRSDVELALVFGSRAKGTSHPGSDVDVAIVRSSQRRRAW